MWLFRAVDALWKLLSASRLIRRGHELPTGRAGFHKTVELLTAARNSTYTVFRIVHRCGDGDGFSYIIHNEKQYSNRSSKGD